ncbi:MAG: PD-(D/E)XK nuclease family protein, partial [Clostridia bacterium]|nr:PD-(D/E)XK nuclease family protein [Clostridia bacterium]
RGESLRLSPSKIELYRGCPFSYFGNAVMKLKEKKTNRFANQESGTFLHAVLEQFIRAHVQDGKFVPAESEEALRREADGYIDDYLSRVIGGEDHKSKRFLHTCENLKKTLYLLLSNLSGELSCSDFLPAGFEVSMGMKGSKLPAVEYLTPEGKRVYLIGSIDRVDTYEKDGVTYVRVVDYKSYAKELHMESVEDYGLDQQMLLYLFAYCRLNAKEGEVFVPAGVLYNPVRLTFAKETGGETEEDLQADREKKLCRTGILLEDAEIIHAMDRTESGRYLPVKFDKDGQLKKSKNLLPETEFARLDKLVESQLIRLAEDIFAGEMDIRPLKLGNRHDACQYCKLQSACRFSGEGGTEYES